MDRALAPPPQVTHESFGAGLSWYDFSAPPPTADGGEGGRDEVTRWRRFDETLVAVPPRTSIPPRRTAAPAAAFGAGAPAPHFSPRASPRAPRPRRPGDAGPGVRHGGAVRRRRRLQARARLLPARRAAPARLETARQTTPFRPPTAPMPRPRGSPTVCRPLPAARWRPSSTRWPRRSATASP